MLQRLIYFSERTAGARLQDIVPAAAARNKANAVSGLLIATDECFLQVLEGEREALSNLFQTISRDARHTDIVLASVQEVQAAIYPEWGMAGIEDLSRIAALWGSTYERLFDPRSMTAQRLQDFLRMACFELQAAGETPAPERRSSML